jgi:hypothetical protein
MAQVVARGTLVVLVIALAIAGAASPARGLEASDTDAAQERAAALERADALLRAQQFSRAAAELRAVLAVDPRNRRAQEMLAFALESSGDLGGERRVRSDLVAQYPSDAQARSAYGRVLERSGDERLALAEYKLARRLDSGKPDAQLDAAIDRMEGRTAIEVAAPVDYFSDADATALGAAVGVAVPFGSLDHVAIRAGRIAADDRDSSTATTSDAVSISMVLRKPSGASLIIGPRLQRVAPDDGREDRGVGGEIQGHGPLGSWLEGDARAEIEVPWNESALTVLHGGRTTAAGGSLYAHFRDRRLILQAGVVGRRLSVLSVDPNSDARPEATQTLLVGGADVVVWRRPGAGVRGERCSMRRSLRR